MVVTPSAETGVDPGDDDGTIPATGMMVRHLSKSYGPKPVVNDVSFTAHAGRITALLGPNGAGKTTALRLALGLVRGSGRAWFDGAALAEAPRPWSRVGVVVDGGSFHPRRSARNHLRMVAASCGVARSRVEECLALVGLSEVAARPPRTFSLGMKQRLGLATALLAEPAVLVLDEPANGLDPHGMRWLRDVLRTYCRDGRTVLLSSHLLSEVEQLADDVVVMAQGRVVRTADLSQLLSTTTATEVTLRSVAVAALSDALRRCGGEVRSTGAEEITVTGLDAHSVGRVALTEGIVVHHLSASRPTLEDLFMVMTMDAQDFAADPLATPGTASP